MSNEQLENFVAKVVRAHDADGALLIIVHRNERAEVVAAVRDTDLASEARNIPALLRKLADEVASGGGVPVGRHLQRVEG